MCSSALFHADSKSRDWRLNSSVSFSPQIITSGVSFACETKFIGERWYEDSASSRVESLIEVFVIGSRSKIPETRIALSNFAAMLFNAIATSCAPAE